jgi:DNA sulfur modification protein DndD
LVREYLNQDRQAREPSTPVPNYLVLSAAGQAMLEHLRGNRLAELKSDAHFLLEKLAVVTQEREDLERGLQAAPSEEDVAVLVGRLKKATESLTQLQTEAGRIEAVSEGLKKERKQCERQMEGMWQEEFQREDQKRMIELAARTRGTMQEFLQKATARKIDRLSGLITECFRFLLRKQTLVERILIDPSTFAVTLYDGAGQAISRQRLSEGEKQLFAVSMLWGLARASARPLPAVIDTPMARLDAMHRQHLVQRYFPNASHQVVILSTDTEVDRHYYQLLQPSLARAYHLRYDEVQRMTVGEEGYFWRDDRPPDGLEESA